MSKKLRTAVVAIAAFVLILPLATLVMWSLAAYWRWPELLPSFDGSYWPKLLNSRLLPALLNSVVLSALVTVLSLTLSFAAAKALGTRRFRAKRLIETLLLVPTFIPQISIVFGMRTVFLKLGLYSNFAGLLAAHLVFFVPYATLLLSAVFEGYDLSLEQQSRTLGVGAAQTALFVTLPTVRGGVTVAGVFCFIGSWSVYLLNSIIGNPRFKTLPSVIFPLISVGNNSYSEIAAAIIIYVLPTLLLLVVSATLPTTSNA